MKQYWILLLLGIHFTTAANTKSNGNIIILPKYCKKIKCPALEAPVCVKIKSKSALKKDIYVQMLNKCEMDYSKCLKDTEVIVVPMKYCNHSLANANIHKRTKRNKREATDIQESPEVVQLVNPGEERSNINSEEDVINQTEEELRDEKETDDINEDNDIGISNDQGENDDKYTQAGKQNQGLEDDDNELEKTNLTENEVKDDEKDDERDDTQYLEDEKAGTDKSTSVDADTKRLPSDDNVDEDGKSENGDIFGDIHPFKDENVSDGKDNLDENNETDRNIYENVDIDAKSENRDVLDIHPFKNENVGDGKDNLDENNETDRNIDENVGVDSKNENGDDLDEIHPCKDDNVGGGKDSLDESNETDRNIDKNVDIDSQNEKGDVLGEIHPFKDDNLGDGKDSLDENDEENEIDEKVISKEENNSDFDKIIDNEVVNEILGHKNGDNTPKYFEELLDYDNPSRGKVDNVDMEEYQSSCPSVCPARDQMLCARSKHGSYTTFMSVCHIRMYNCKWPDEKMELVSRYPCVLAAPYIEDVSPKGSLGEPGDDDAVLRFIYCRETGRLDKDRRCSFTEDVGK